ncbi:hypothetical protein BDF19DRAFT_428996 [Syncephalis fuscata]|nr:hypothetical protein BDF19DRAFT_428996 [Syncephalis fuscata]
MNTPQTHVPFLTQEVTTIIVRNLPLLPEQDIQELLTQFGAFQVRVMESPAMRGTAFASFPNQSAAADAIHRINGLELHGKHLRADYSRPPTRQVDARTSNMITPTTHNNNKNNNNNSNSHQHNRSFDVSSRFGMAQPPPLSATPVAPRLGVHYPSPPHLHYLYPPPNPRTLRNIMTAITAVPKLYTQVLHLMNKMNLPPPFEDTEWAPHTPSHPMVEAMEQGRTSTLPSSFPKTATTTTTIIATTAPEQSMALSTSTDNTSVIDNNNGNNDNYHGPTNVKRKRSLADELLSSDESELASEDESSSTTRTAMTAITLHCHQ